MIRFDREDYENRVVATLRDEFVDHDAGRYRRGKRIIVEDVKIIPTKMRPRKATTIKRGAESLGNT